MALAWKAGWVQALTSSNLVSSATANCTMTRAYAPHRAQLEASDPLSVRYFCAIFRGAPSEQGSGDRSGSAAGDEFVQFDWLRQRLNKVVLGLGRGPDCPWWGSCFTCTSSAQQLSALAHRRRTAFGAASMRSFWNNYIGESFHNYQ